MTIVSAIYIYNTVILFLIVFFYELFFFERASDAGAERELQRILNLPPTDRVTRGHNRFMNQ